MTSNNIGRGIFIQGECLEVMRQMPSRSFDMILADLPYGTTQNKWDSVIDFKQLWAEYKRLCTGAIVLTSQMPFSATMAASNFDDFKYEWVWDKVNRKTGFLNAKKQPLKVTESVLVFYSKQPVYNPQMTVGKPYKATSKGAKSNNYGSQADGVTTINNGEYYPTNLISIPADERGTEGRIHPTQKPVALFEYLIRTYTNEGQRVLDNTAGSGTTAIAAENCGRNWVCIEQSQEYYTKAVERVNTHLWSFVHEAIAA